MAVTIQHLNSDATFLFTFEPRSYENGQADQSRSPKPFRILLDPWITGPAKFIHPKIARASHRQPPCILSLLELPEPDLVIISHNSSKHCNEATLRQFPAIGTKTVILATPASANKIKSWKYFEKSKVKILTKWKAPESGEPHIIRFTAPSTPPGEPGEITVAFIPQKHDILGLHYAIGITYRPPPPPLYHLPLPPRLRSKSQTSLGTPLSPTLTRQEQQHPLPPPDDRPISILYIPHGISYPSIHSYATNHLISEAALPLTALLHPFNTPHRRHHQASFSKTHSPTPSGLEIATKLAAKTWISAHDGDLVHRGLIKRLPARKEKTAHNEHDIKGFLAKHDSKGNTTAVVALESGEKTTLHSTTSKTGTADNSRETRDNQGPPNAEDNNFSTDETEGERGGTGKEEEDGRPSPTDAIPSGSRTAQSTPAASASAAAAELSPGSLEKCHWRSNLELFLKKEEVYGGRAAA